MIDAMYNPSAAKKVAYKTIPKKWVPVYSFVSRAAKQEYDPQKPE